MFFNGQICVDYLTGIYTIVNTEVDSHVENVKEVNFL